MKASSILALGLAASIAGVVPALAQENNTGTDQTTTGQTAEQAGQETGATGASGEIRPLTITCQDLSPGNYVELSVTDSGTGMPPEVVARALDPFFTTKGVAKGTGLGLSQVYGMARQAGGTVRIESRLGEGTTVRVLLPRTETVPEDRDGLSTLPEPSPEGPGASILVVDDDPDVRAMLLASLDALGYQALEAQDGATGLSVLTESQADLMLVDFAMPDMTGAEVALAARKQRPDLPIVFISGYSDTAAIEAAAGKDPVMLRKPFPVDELQVVLRKVLARPSPDWC